MKLCIKKEGTGLCYKIEMQAMALEKFQKLPNEINKVHKPYSSQIS
jgi:hypothetical protein